MVIITFVGKDLRRVACKALDFWYKKMRDKHTLLDFIKKCIWKRSGNTYIVIYRGL